MTITEREEEPTFGDRALGAIRRVISLLAVAALLLWLLPWSIEGTAHTLRDRPAASFGFGALGLSGSIVAIGAVMIGTALLAIILGLLTLGELVVLATSASIVAIIVFVFLLVIVLAYLAPAAVGMAVAGLALEQAWATRRWLLLVLGVLGVVIVTSIPVLGGWLGFVIVVFGLGAFLLTANARRRRTQPLPPPPMPAPAS